MKKLKEYLELLNKEPQKGSIHSVETKLIHGDFTLDSDGKISEINISLKPNMRLDPKVIISEVTLLMQKITPQVNQKIKNQQQMTPGAQLPIQSGPAAVGTTIGKPLGV